MCMLIFIGVVYLFFCKHKYWDLEDGWISMFTKVSFHNMVMSILKLSNQMKDIEEYLSLLLYNVTAMRIGIF